MFELPEVDSSLLEAVTAIISMDFLQPSLEARAFALRLICKGLTLDMLEMMLGTLGPGEVLLEALQDFLEEDSSSAPSTPSKAPPTPPARRPGASGRTPCPPG